MGLMDKAKKAVKGRSEQIERGVDKASKMVDERTGGKYRDKLSKGADQVKARARSMDEDRPAGTDRGTRTTGEGPAGTGPGTTGGPATTGGTGTPAGDRPPATEPGTGGHDRPTGTGQTDNTPGL